MQPKAPITLTHQNLDKARHILLEITTLLSDHKIPYHLEGGTLLGIVRDNELLPWDNDLDISIPSAAAPDFIKLKWTLLRRGYKLSVRKSEKDKGPFKKGDYTLFKIKPLDSYIKAWFTKNPDKQFVVMDVFVKANDNDFTYWQAKDNIMRVSKKHYKTFEPIEYANQTLQAPNDYKEYLTHKYGDWSTPVKEWDCAKNEGTIIRS